MRYFLLSVVVLFSSLSLSFSQQYRQPVKPTKNIILMIPDGTSIGVVSAARWYQIYNQLGSDNLAVDPYICGTVKTYSLNAPIGDSAPTMACYMTGIPQRAGNISIYPLVDEKYDLVKLDSTLSFQPLATILEALKYEKNKATGLVVTIEFPHATPAGCASHYYNRNQYDAIASQMAHNDLDVVFAGGNSIISGSMKQYFKQNNTLLIQDDINTFRAFDDDRKVWALFENMSMPYDLDRDTAQIPSLAEMTKKAIHQLSKNENGFFLMVEGSKVDHAAHSNDAVGCITEYLAFDKAVAEAIEFAKRDGETTVIVVPDHGNSGFTIGKSGLSYGKATIDDLFETVSQYKRTANGLEKILLKTRPSEFKSVFYNYTNIDLTDEELELLLSSKNYVEDDYMNISNSVNMESSIVKIMNSKTFFGFTSGGHTGEEVFLAVYHPNGDVPIGMNTNIELNHYLFDVAGLDKSLADLSNELFAKHTDVFAGLKWKIEETGEFPVLTVTKGRNTLTVPAFESQAYFNKKMISLNSVTVYIDKNNTFYLPQKLADYFK